MTPSAAPGRRKSTHPKTAAAREKRRRTATTESAAAPQRAPRKPRAKSAAPASAKRTAKHGLMARRAPPPAPQGLEVDPDVLQFIEALDLYRHQHSRPFPSWSEVLHVLRWLGYRKA
ncbi:MAG: hypothetical protein IPM29_13625 [Planctomycetes bacterium]|nr:hypothetical protein [Planctomycetota bacterium]